MAIGAWPAEAGSRLGSPLLLAAILSAWAMLLAAAIHHYRHATAVWPFWTVVTTGAAMAIASHLSSRHAVTFWPLWPVIALLAAAGGLRLLRARSARFGDAAYGATALAVLLLILWAYLVGRPPDMIRGTPRAVTARPDLNHATDALLARQAALKAAPVIVIVAASGGGIKASYWTAKVLGRATDLAPSLRDQLLVASGVSGGSLGLALYRGLLSTPSPRCDADEPGGPLERCVAAFHRQDLLPA